MIIFLLFAFSIVLLSCLIVKIRSTVDLSFPPNSAITPSTHVLDLFLIISASILYVVSNKTISGWKICAIIYITQFCGYCVTCYLYVVCSISIENFEFPQVTYIRFSIFLWRYVDTYIPHLGR